MDLERDNLFHFLDTNLACSHIYHGFLKALYSNWGIQSMSLHLTSSLPIACDRRCPWGSWATEFCLHKDFLHAICSLVEDVVDEVHLLHQDTVSEHGVWVCLALLDHFEKFFPVEVDRRLTITNETDATLHNRADIEVVSL